MEIIIQSRVTFSTPCSCCENWIKYLEAETRLISSWALWICLLQNIRLVERLKFPLQLITLKIRFTKPVMARLQCNLFLFRVASFFQLAALSQKSHSPEYFLHFSMLLKKEDSGSFNIKAKFVIAVSAGEGNIDNFAKKFIFLNFSK